MGDTKRTVVTVETRERTVVRSRHGRMVAWCARCGSEVQLLTPAEAGALAREAAALAAYGRVGAGGLHFETDDGEPFACRQLPPAAEPHDP